MRDSHGEEIEKGKPYNLYRYKNNYDFKDIGLEKQYQLVEDNVSNLSRWFAIQDENYLLDVFSKLPDFAKEKLMKVLKGES